jgi:hypothetical protein
MAALRRSFPDEAHLIPLPSERSNRTAAPSRTDGLTWSIIKTPALTSEIRFRFGLSIEGDEKKNSKDILAAPSCTSIRMRTCKFGCFRFCGHTRRRGTKVGGAIRTGPQGSNPRRPNEPVLRCSERQTLSEGFCKCRSPR